MGTGCDVAPQQPDHADRSARGELRMIAKGGGIGYAARMADQCIGVVASLLYARALGAAGYGLFSIGRTAGRMLALVCVLGMEQTVARFMSVANGRGEEGGARGVLAGGAAIAGLGTILASVGLGILADPIASVAFGKPELGPVLRIASLAVPLLGVSPVLASAARVRGTIVPKMAGELAGRSFLLLVLAYVWLQGLGVTTVMWGFAIGAGLTFGITSGLVLRRSPELLRGSGAARPCLGSLAAYGFPIALANLADSGLMPCAILLLGARNTSAETGIFTVAMFVALTAQYPILALGELFDPVIARLHAAGDLQRLQRLTRTVTKWSAAVALPLLIACLSQRDGIMAIFGPDFRERGLPLACMAIAILAWIAPGPSGLLLIMTGRQWLDLLNRLGAAAVSIGLTWALAPEHGAEGTAIALAAGHSVLSVLRVAEVWRLLRIWPYDRRLVKPLIASLACSVPLWVWHPHGPLPAIALIMGYLGLYLLAYWLSGLDADDREVMQAVKERLSGAVRHADGSQ